MGLLLNQHPHLPHKAHQPQAEAPGLRAHPHRPSSGALATTCGYQCCPLGTASPITQIQVRAHTRTHTYTPPRGGCMVTKTFIRLFKMLAFMYSEVYIKQLHRILRSLWELMCYTHEPGRDSREPRLGGIGLKNWVSFSSKGLRAAGKEARVTSGVWLSPTAQISAAAPVPSSREGAPSSDCTPRHTSLVPNIFMWQTHPRIIHWTRSL